VRVAHRSRRRELPSRREFRRGSPGIRRSGSPGILRKHRRRFMLAIHRKGRRQVTLGFRRRGIPPISHPVTLAIRRKDRRRGTRAIRNKDRRPVIPGIRRKDRRPATLAILRKHRRRVTLGFRRKDLHDPRNTVRPVHAGRIWSPSSVPRVATASLRWRCCR
jgi:hypothetical protein